MYTVTQYVCVYRLAGHLPIARTRATLLYTLSTHIIIIPTYTTYREHPYNPPFDPSLHACVSIVHYTTICCIWRFTDECTGTHASHKPLAWIIIWWKGMLVVSYYTRALVFPNSNRSSSSSTNKHQGMPRSLLRTEILKPRYIRTCIMCLKQSHMRANRMC
jgi:hypothetical protein